MQQSLSTPSPSCGHRHHRPRPAPTIDLPDPQPKVLDELAWMPVDLLTHPLADIGLGRGREEVVGSVACLSRR